MYFFYIFECKDKSFYAGVTNNPSKREQLHNTGLGAKYTASRGGGKIIYTERYRSLKNAMKREAAVKKWPRKKKEDLVSGKNILNRFPK